MEAADCNRDTGEQRRECVAEVQQEKIDEMPPSIDNTTATATLMATKRQNPPTDVRPEKSVYLVNAVL